MTTSWPSARRRRACPFGGQPDGVRAPDLAVAQDLSGGHVRDQVLRCFWRGLRDRPLSVGAKCPEVVAALEGMANDVVPKHGVSCTMAGYTTTAEPEQGGSGLQTVAYDLVFEENPGDLKPIEVNAYLDGERPTVYLSDGNSTDQEFNVDIDVFPNWKGISGEVRRLLPVHLPRRPDQRGEDADLSERTLGAAYTDSTKGLTPDEEKLLKACLGDADGDADNNVEVYNWDYGTPNSTNTPHIVKLAPTDDSKSGMYDAGTFNLVWYGRTNDHASTIRTSSTSAACRRPTPPRSSPSSRRPASPRSSPPVSPTRRAASSTRRAASTRPTPRPSRPASRAARRRSTRATTRPAPRRASTTPPRSSS